MSSSSSGRSKSSNGTRPGASVASNVSNNSNGAPPGPPNYRSSSNVRPSIRSSNGNAQEKRKIVGQYMLGKTIGEGTFGKVKLAIHIPTGEKVAVKILEKSRIKEQADVRRVNREIKILKKSRHGNIIQLYEVLDTQNTIYLIMECADGGEMFDFIVAQKHVPEQQACKFFHQIIDGVEVLHNNDITHRDLKPENLLLKASADGWLVKIVDFGLSNTHEGNKLLSTACGSPCYAAPEMIAGKKYNGPLADLWSIGVILFALVCGFLPFEDSNTAMLYKKIMAGDYKPPKWISAEVRDLIRCILEVDPRKRYTISEIRKHSWYAIVPESAVPREVVNLTEAEQVKAEIIKAIALAGLDTQAVLDGVASHACNSLTAMFHLLEQKHRIAKLKQGGASKPAVTLTQPPLMTQDPAERSSADSNSSVNPPDQATNRMPPMVIARPPASGQGGIPATDVTPYRQTPVILTQHFNNSNPNPNPTNPTPPPALAVRQPNPTMPSLDSYLKTGMGFPNLTNFINNNGPVNPGNSRDRIRNNLLTKRNEVPKLNLSSANTALPPALAPPLAEENVFTSQTARVGQVAVPIRDATGYLTSRPADSGATGVTKELLELMLGAGLGLGQEGVDRPNTRRSHNRSRGQGDETSPLETPLVVSAPHNPVPPPATGVKTGSGLNALNPIPNANPNLNPNPNAVNPRAPEGSGLSGPVGGRKGRNLTETTAARPPAGVNNAPSSSSSSSSSSAGPAAAVVTVADGGPNLLFAVAPAPPPSSGPGESTNPRFLALRNKLAAQGTLSGASNGGVVGNNNNNFSNNKPSVA